MNNNAHSVPELIIVQISKPKWNECSTQREKNTQSPGDTFFRASALIKTTKCVEMEYKLK